MLGARRRGSHVLTSWRCGACASWPAQCGDCYRREQRDLRPRVAQPATDVDPRPCECGAAKPAGTECCARCAWLDGIPVTQAQVGQHHDWEIIAMMRERLGAGATVEELAARLARAPRSLARTVSRLSRGGRVHRVLEETEDGQLRARYHLDSAAAPRPGPQLGRRGKPGDRDVTGARPR